MQTKATKESRKWKEEEKLQFEISNDKQPKLPTRQPGHGYEIKISRGKLILF